MISVGSPWYAPPVPGTDHTCAVCGYDLGVVAVDGACPECGTHARDRTIAVHFERIDRRRSIRVFAILMAPAWFFLVTNIIGYAAAFWILALPRGVPIDFGQSVWLDRLFLIHLLGMVLLPASGAGLLISPFMVIPAFRRFQRGEDHRRLPLLLVLALPSVALVALMAIETSPVTLFTWVPD